MGHVAAEVAHDAEGVGQECLHVEVGEAGDVGCAVLAVGVLAAVEAHLVQAVDRLADLALLHIFAGFLRRGRKVVVEVAAEVEVHLGGLGNHLTGLIDLIGDRLFHKHVLTGLQGFHGRFEVPAAVFEAAGGDIHDVQLFVLQHFGEAGVAAHAVHLRGLVSALFDEVADGDQFGEGILRIGACVPLTDAAGADDSDFACHYSILR